MSLYRADAAAQYLANLVESSDDAIISKDPDGTITSWNRGAERIFGFSASEAIGRSIRIIIPPDRQSEEDDVLARIRAGQVVDHFETMRMRKDGTLLPVSITVSPIRDDSGRIIGASKIGRDISERKRAEAELAEAEVRQADLRQRLQDLVFGAGSLFVSPRLQDVLPAALKLTRQLIPADAHAIWRRDWTDNQWRIASYSGVSEEFAQTLPIGESALGHLLVAEDVRAVESLRPRLGAFDREGIVSLLAVPLTVGGRVTSSLALYYRTPHAFSDVEIETARALGNLAAAAIRTAELYDEQRTVQQQALFLAQAAETLAASLKYRDTLKALARLAVPHISDWCAVDLVNDDGTIERLVVAYVDPTKAELARVFQTCYSVDTGSPYEVHRVLRTGTSVIVEHVTDMPIEGAISPELLEALRALAPESFMCVPLKTRDGIRGALTFVSAESGRRYSRADLRFAENVADRAAIAIETARAYEEAHTANRLKDDFLATLSHELRTPLNAILGYTRLLRSGIIPPEKRDSSLETIERNATSLTQIVEDVLDVSRIVTAKLRLTINAVEVGGLVQEVIASLMPAAEAKGVRLVADIQLDASTIAGDRDRLVQVFSNLLSNAVKFTPRAGTISVSVTRTGDSVEVVVSDTGRGIPSEFLPFVFDRFRQADTQSTREQGGLGLGLSIARDIVEMHGGTICVESAGENKGATFRVVLPAGRESTDIPRSSAQASDVVAGDS